MKFDNLYRLLAESDLSKADERKIFKLLNSEIDKQLKSIKYEYAQALPDYNNRDRIKLLLSNSIKLKGTLADQFNKVGITDTSDQLEEVSKFYSGGQDSIKKLKLKTPKFNAKLIQDMLTTISNKNDDFEFTIGGKPEYTVGVGDDYPDEALSRTELNLDTRLSIDVNIKGNVTSDPVSKFKKGDTIKYKLGKNGNEQYGIIDSEPRFRIGIGKDKDAFEYSVSPITKWGEELNTSTKYLNLEDPMYYTSLHDPKKFKKPAPVTTTKAPIKTIDEDAILKYIKKYKNWNVDDSDDQSILISTREHGNTYAEEPGQEDIDEAKKIIKDLKNKFNDIKIVPEIVDEYVTLNIIAS